MPCPEPVRPRYVVGRHRSATLEDLKQPFLQDPRTGIFYNVPDETLRRIAAGSLVWRLNEKETLFQQDQPTDGMPLYVLLSGRLRVQHTTLDKKLIVAEDLP